VRLLRKSGTQVSKRKHECEKLRNEPKSPKTERYLDDDEK